MNLIRISTGEYPVSYRTFRSRFPGIMFPKNPTHAVFEPFGYAVVHSTVPPACSIYQKVVETAPALIDGIWTQQWQVVDLDGDELTAVQNRVAKEQDIAKNLPSLSTIEGAIDNLSNLDDVKTFLKKLVRVVCWDVKNRLD